jgi:hypothetical protein
MVALACTVFWVLGQAETASLPPPALVKFYEARARLLTGEIDWSRRDYSIPGWRSQHTNYYTTRLAPRERTLHSRGDEEGVPMRDEAGNPSKADTGYFASFEGPNMCFDRYEGEHVPYDANWLPKGATAGTPDLRSLGALPTFCYDEVQDALFKYTREYTESRDGALYVVTAQRGGEMLSWWIDPERDWQATRVTYAHEGVVAMEARVALAKFGNYWFPQSVAFSSRGYKDGTEPVDVVTVEKAVFNDPRQLKVLTPAEIGVTPGMYIWLKDNHMQKVGTGNWDGTRITGVHFFPGMELAGELVQRELAKAEAVSPTSQPVPPESEWAAYTRRFIDRYKLADDQTQSALQILKNAQEEAQRYLTRHAEDFKKLGDDEAAAPRAAAPDSALRRTELHDRRAKLRAPIDQIFEKQLKAPLEKLPTRKQRAAAEGAETTGKRGER